MKNLNINSIATERIDWDDTQVVDRVIRQYEDHPKAFQKEAIQNAWDARLDKKKGEGWRLEIYLHKDNNGKTHLVIEDFGTTGMNDRRLDAFLSLWKPHKEYLDAGGQGQGKFVLMGASKEEILIVESIDEKNSYRCRFLQRGRKSKEDINVNDLIPEIKPLGHRGTRIWVYDIKREFLEKVSSPEFVDFILESWWQILEARFNGKIILFGKEIKLPKIPAPKEEVILLENKQLEKFGKIKRLVLKFYDKPIPGIFQGIRIQRANMMITKIPFEVYEKDYKGKFSGYIEFDRDLESLLKDIERSDHCSFRYESPWKEIKLLLKEEAEKFVNKILPKKQERKTIQLKNLNKIIQKANQIIGEFCPEVIGTGTTVPSIPRKAKPPLRIKYLTINKREVKYGDSIFPSLSIINETEEDKKVLLRMELKKNGNRLTGEEYKFKLMSNQQKLMKLSEIKLEKENYSKGKYTIRVTLEENRREVDTKATSFYLEVKREPIKKGFIKQIRLLKDFETPFRYKVITQGVLLVNLGHKDPWVIREILKNKPTILNKQWEYYIIKICIEEAINQLMKIRFQETPDLDPDDLVKEINNLKDRMYYEVYT